MALMNLEKQLLFVGSTRWPDDDKADAGIDSMARITIILCVVRLAKCFRVFVFSPTGARTGMLNEVFDIKLTIATRSTLAYMLSNACTSQATNTPSIGSLQIPSVPSLLVTTSATTVPLNLGTLTAALYAFLYVLLEPVAGLLLAPLLLSGTIYSNTLTHNPSTSTSANYVGLGLHIVSWIAQFVGHGVFEKRAPALLDNLVQALFLAPFFVWMEILFVVGYRPDLKRRIDSKVEESVKNFEKGKEVNGSSKKAR
ncbi:MAG: hypothetical protein M1831_000605 [Alyxoria varia]|nr:MAG: hypothetical protein M1831_000605 [Alyxoria varia]